MIIDPSNNTPSNNTTTKTATKGGFMNYSAVGAAARAVVGVLATEGACLLLRWACQKS